MQDEMKREHYYDFWNLRSKQKHNRSFHIGSGILGTSLDPEVLKVLS